MPNKRHAADAKAPVARLEAAVAAAGGWPSLVGLPLGQRAPLPEYTSPKICVQVCSEGKGRGLFTKAQCQAGELLLLSRPFAAVAPTKGAPIEEPGFARLVKTVVKNLHGIGKRDVGLLLELRHNEKGCPASNKKELEELNSLLEPPSVQLGDSPQDGSVMEADALSAASPVLLRHCRDVVTYNGREVQQSGSMWTAPAVKSVGKSASMDFALGVRAFLAPMARPQALNGLWLVPAFMNHSCAPSCVFWVCGDMLCFRAAHDLAAGDELTDAYIDIFHSAVDRQAWLSHFSCMCLRCSLEQRLPRWQATSSRLKPHFEAQQAMGNPQLLQDLWSELIQSVEQDITDENNLKHDFLVAGCLQLPLRAAVAIQAAGRPVEAAEWLEKAAKVAATVWPLSPCALDIQVLHFACLCTAALQVQSARTKRRQRVRESMEAIPQLLDALRSAFTCALGASAEAFETWLLEDRLREMPKTWRQAVRQVLQAKVASSGEDINQRECEQNLSMERIDTESLADDVASQSELVVNFSGVLLDEMD